LDGLKVIPQLFFDLIARVVPGITALAVLCITVPALDWASLLSRIAGGKFDQGNAVAFVVLGTLVGGYVIGQVIAPFGKGIESLASRRSTIPDEIWNDYDYLRLYHAEAGAIVAKIRAEYIMQFSMAAVFLLGFVTTIAASVMTDPPSLGWAVVFILLFCSSLYRAADSRRTFQKGVRNFRAATRGSPTGPPSGAEPGG
jgi:hypothetical protein